MSSRNWQDWLIGRFLGKTRYESHMEDLFAASFHCVMALSGYEGKARLDPQCEEGPYRIDFALRANGVHAECRIAIEIDGHDFHEKTKEQAAHDKSRDRFLVSRGWSIYRFTGSEINKNPFRCAEEIRDAWLVATTGKTAMQAISEAHMDRIQRMLTGQ